MHFYEDVLFLGLFLIKKEKKGFQKSDKERFIQGLIIKYSGFNKAWETQG